MANAERAMGFVRKENIMTQSRKPEPQVQSRSVGKIDYEHLQIVDALKQLGVDPKSGLSDAEVKKRLEKYGPNALPEKKVSAFEMFGKFFWGPMPWMIEAAAIMSILVKDLIDFIIIMVRLLFNAVLGFWHDCLNRELHMTAGDSGHCPYRKLKPDNIDE